MIQLTPLSEQELEEYLQVSIKNYANEKIESGNWSADEALDRSRKEFEALLPNGTSTKGQHLFSIRDDVTNKKVGIIWVGLENTGHEVKGAWIWDFVIYENERGKGYGTKTLEALDAWLANNGQKSVSLHVFGHNETAISLYRKMGYKVTNLVMSKVIGSQ